MRLQQWHADANFLAIISLFCSGARATFNDSQSAIFGSLSIQTVTATSTLGPLPSADLLALAKKPTINGFQSQLTPCPASCIDTGTIPSNWTAYHDSNRLVSRFTSFEGVFGP